MNLRFAFKQDCDQNLLKYKDIKIHMLYAGLTNGPSFERDVVLYELRLFSLYFVQEGKYINFSNKYGNFEETNLVQMVMV